MIRSLEARVRGRVELEEKYAGLLNKLIVHQALFNRLTAQLLVLRQALDSETREQLARASRELDQSLRISQQVRRELHRLT